MRLTFLLCLMLLAAAVSGCTIQNLPNGSILITRVPVTSLFQAYRLDPQEQNTAFSEEPIAGIFPAPGYTSTYFGQVDGGNGRLRLADTGRGRFEVAIEVSGRGEGAVEGRAMVRVDRILVMREGFLPGQRPATCDMVLKPYGNGVAVTERNCFAFHGEQISFTGIFYAQG